MSETNALNSINTIFGGEAKSSDSGYKFVLAAFIIGLVIWLIYKFYFKNESQQSTFTHEYLKISGDYKGPEVRAAIQKGEVQTKKTALDHYRIGSLYLYNAADHHKAHEHFNQALQLLSEDRPNANFILDKLEDQLDQFIDFQDLEDLPLQQALEEQYTYNIQNPHSTKWTSDSQNVHDESINKELNRQFSIVEMDNAVIDLIHDYQEIKKSIPRNDRINAVFTLLDYNYETKLIPGHREQDIITAVWKRSFDTRNAETAEQIRDALKAALEDCFETYGVVCIDGRIVKIWQALACLDFDSSIGILKSKQVLRHEIYNKCSQIINKCLKASPEEVQKEYLVEGESLRIRELKDTIKKEIDGLYSEYKGLISDEQLNMIINECKAEV